MRLARRRRTNSQGKELYDYDSSQILRCICLQLASLEVSHIERSRTKSPSTTACPDPDSAGLIENEFRRETTGGDGRRRELERILAMRGTVSECPTMTNRRLQSALVMYLARCPIKGTIISPARRLLRLEPRIPHAGRSRCAWRR